MLAGHLRCRRKVIFIGASGYRVENQNYGKLIA